MDRLAEKLKQAAGVAQRATTRIEARADELIAREGAIRKREDEAFSPHETILNDAEKGLDAVERALGQLSNSPLQASGASLDGFVPIRGAPQADATKVESAPSVGLLNIGLTTSPENHTRDSNGHVIEK